LRLRSAEAAKRAVGRRVRHGDPTADANLAAAIRPGRVQDASREDDGGERDVGAAVEQYLDVDRGQPPVLRDAGPVTDGAGMPLRGGEHVLDAVVDDLDASTPRQPQ